MLKCRDVLEQAEGYLANNLTDWQRFQFKLHLMLCKNCRRYLRHLRLTEQLSQRLVLSEAKPSESDLEALMQLIGQDVVEKSRSE